MSNISECQTIVCALQITVDLSPPHPGQVHDGMSGSPEVDYQADTELHAHWSGFFDRESGVKYYQYAFDTACVAASAFTFDTADARVSGIILFCIKLQIAV